MLVDASELPPVQAARAVSPKAKKKTEKLHMAWRNTACVLVCRPATRSASDDVVQKAKVSCLSAEL